MSAERPFAFTIRRAAAKLTRLGRLIVFGFEQIVLTRLFEQHQPGPITAALLSTKGVDAPPPQLLVRGRDGQAIEAWIDGFAAANAALFLNLRMPSAISPVRYALPAPAFRAVYLWDSAFIAQIWKWWSPETGWDILNAVLRCRDGDRLQHFVSEFARSSFTQPPLIAWSLHGLAEAVEPETYRAWSAQAFWPLLSYQRWLDAHRRLPNGLYAWAHAYESGVENAPRFGDREERRLRDTRGIAAPDFSAYVVLQLDALAAMAQTLGYCREASVLARDADTLRARVNAELWDEADGLYYDRDTRSGAFIRSQSIACLMPLWAGIPDARRAERLLEHILDPAGFNTLIPLPSMAIGDPAFERDMWRGPVWVNMAFAVIDGMRRYGFDEAAADFAYRLCDGVYRTHARTGRFFEFYDPTAYTVRDLERKRGNQWKALTLGTKPVSNFVGWTGLVNTLVIEALFGLHLTSQGPALQPRFPRRAEGRRFCLSLPGRRLEVELDVLAGGETRGEIRTDSGTQSFRARFGQRVGFDAPQLLSQGAAS